jgi:peptidoglycan hydrolase CwlO-like protein
MKIKRSSQMLGVLMVALFFVTNVNAFSDRIHENTTQKKKRQNPFFQLRSDIAQLKNEIAALQAATNRSESNNTSLAEKLDKLESDITTLQDRIDAMSSQISTANFDDIKLGKYHLILPRGYFVQSMHEFDQFDFSGAYLI